MRAALISASLIIAASVPAAVYAADAPTRFASRGADRKAIEALLTNYTKAVSSKDQALFESLLLNKAIPFYAATAAVKSAGAEGGTQNYPDFRTGVFDGPPFKQRFRDIHIRQDGPLADVSLVFINTSASGTDWGWKTLQLLKVDGRWKIASEFFTNHS